MDFTPPELILLDLYCRPGFNFKGLSFLDIIPKKLDVIPQFCMNWPMFGTIGKLRSYAIGCYAQVFNSLKKSIVWVMFYCILDA